MQQLPEVSFRLHVDSEISSLFLKHKSVQRNGIVPGARLNSYGEFIVFERYCPCQIRDNFRDRSIQCSQMNTHKNSVLFIDIFDFIKQDLEKERWHRFVHFEMNQIEPGIIQIVDGYIGSSLDK